MSVKTLFFEVMSEVQKDSEDISAGIGILKKIKLLNKFSRSLRSKSARSTLTSPGPNKVNPGHLHLPPPLPYLPGHWKLSLLVALNQDGPGQCSGHLQAAQPRSWGPWRVYINIVLYLSSSNTVSWNALPNDYLHSTDYCNIFRFD
jgi:hypothetical protein